ncbi:MAG: biotin carboxylase N-terminal domain-containing protein [Burkholderiales bacterium]
MPAFRSLLIANRGEISLRIQRTARRMGLRTIAVYSDADREARHAREADMAARIGPASPRESYLNIDAIIEAARRSRADAVHPGYGFLAENAAFADAVIGAGLAWVGPPPAAIRAMGNKSQAKRLARAAGVPVLPGYDDPDQSDTAIAEAAVKTGFPLMIKAAAGGGGRGMRLVRTLDEFPAALDQARSEARHAFGDASVLLEGALLAARHVEVQVFADAHGGCVHMGERDCSVQRRHQKLIEETPSPAVDGPLRTRMGAAAVAVARASGYAGAGTVEFLLGDEGQFWFMEMNTRLQVEHAVTEAVTGLDLVEWQLRIAAGEPLPLRQADIRFSGHAIEARLCAEDPALDCLPQSGALALWREPRGIRVDHALESGAEISPYYDSMIAKLVVHAPTRDAAREQLAAALDATVALGIDTNKALLAAVLRDEVFARRGPTTEFLSRRFARVRPVPASADDLAIAAMLVADDAARRAGHGEWSSWSNNPARLQRLKLACNGDAAEIGIETGHGRCVAHVGAEAIGIRIVSVEGARARIELRGLVEESVDFRAEGGTLHLARNGKSLRLANVLHAPAARPEGGTGDGRVLAPMNARVAAVHVAPGQRVEAGAPLVVLEAMKMEHALAAPAAARVKAVHVAAGAQVAPGQLLAELEPE